jgi:hypothetical protein
MKIIKRYNIYKSDKVYILLKMFTFKSIFEDNNYNKKDLSEGKMMVSYIYEYSNVIVLLRSVLGIRNLSLENFCQKLDFTTWRCLLLPVGLLYYRYAINKSCHSRKHQYKLDKFCTMKVNTAET